MKLIFTFSVVFIKIFFINLFEVGEIIRTFGIHTFMNNEVFTGLAWNKGIQAVRAAECCCPGKSAFVRTELSGTDLAENLAFGTIVFIKISFRGITAWTFTVIINVAFRTSGNRLDFPAIFPFDVRNVVMVIPRLVMEYLRQFINLEFLIFWRMGIIENPLLERNISANKSKKVANNSLQVLNVLK